MVPISVCIPVYNGGAYLEECLESVLRQTFDNFEIVIVDDRSTDQSYDIVTQYAAEDSRIRVIRNKKNLGLVENWNRCVDLSRGEWIKFVFQDDLIEPDCLKEMIRNAVPEKGMVVCRRNIIYEDIDQEFRYWFDKIVNMKSLDTIFGGRRDISPDEFCNRVMDHLGHNFVGEPTAVLLHKSVFPRFGRFNDKFIQLCDLEFWARVCCNCGLVYIPETLATFRLHNRGASLINRDRQIYRTTVLEFVLLYYEFAYNPLFQRLRDNGRRRYPKRNMEGFAVLERIRAMEIAKNIEKRSSEYDYSPAGELNFLLKDYPKGENIFYYRWLKIIGPVIQHRRVLNFIYKRVLSRVSF